AEHIAAVGRLRALTKIEVEGHAGPGLGPLVPLLTGAIKTVEAPALPMRVLVSAERGDGAHDAAAPARMARDVKLGDAVLWRGPQPRVGHLGNVPIGKG